jgi:hypothetical protein
MKARIGFPLVLTIALSVAPAAPEDAGAPVDADADAAASSAEALPFVGPVPEGKSKPPTPAEWKAANDLAIGVIGCSARRVREWMQIHCEVMRTMAIELVTGTASDLFFSVRPGGGTCIQDNYEGQICSDSDDMVFALRRGDRRVLQIIQGGFGYGVSRTAVWVFSETWLADDAGPIVTAIEVR